MKNLKQLILLPIIFSIPLLIFSCSNNLDKKIIGDNNSKSQSWSMKLNTSWSWASKNSNSNTIKVNNINIIKNIQSIRSSYEWFKLSWDIKPDIEKIEIVWKNWNKIDSYFLKTYVKWSSTFSTNLKIYLWNLGYWINTYTIRGYIEDKIVSEGKYDLNFEKSGCEILFKRKIMTSDWDPANILKYKDKIRKFSIFKDWSCKDKLITEQTWDFSLSDWINVDIMDLLDASIWFERWDKILKQENINNLNWLKSNIKASITWSCSDTEDSTCTKIPSDSKLLRYDIIWFNDTLQFWVIKW